MIKSSGKHAQMGSWLRRGIAMASRRRPIENGMTMSRRNILTLISGLTLGGCGFSPVSYRVRMTVEARTQGGVVSGSSVFEIREQRQILGTSETSAVSAGLSGEAVVVDVPEGPVFVLLKLREGSPLLLQAISDALLPIKNPAPKTDDYLDQVRRLGRASPGEYKATLPREHWPMMVRFSDPRDPKTVECINSPIKDVLNINIETSRDAVTGGIEKQLPWLSLPMEQLKPMLKGPCWDWRDPGFQYGGNLSIFYFKA